MITRAVLVAVLIAPVLALAAPRPLPAAPARPAASGKSYYVSTTGDDAAAGDKEHPWRSVARAANRLKPGETLYLFGGVYFETVTISAKGSLKAPITLRSAPGEIAILDGGLREFEEKPASAWKPLANGEYISTQTYPALGSKPRFLVPHLADTMVPLHPYKFAVDLRATNVYWNLAKGTEPGAGIYVGPGLWFDPATQRIHARLEPTALKNQDNYAGATDPRKVPLVVGVDRTPLAIEGAAHVRVQDLVLRGSATNTLRIDRSEHVDIDGVTIYGGAPAVYLRSTKSFRFIRSTVRGLAAPWASRASMKYRGNSPYLFFLDSALPQSEDWEIAYSEFTDGHDGVVIDSAKNVRFHHNRLDNFNDDALYLTLTPRESVPTNVQIFENHVSRAYTVIAFGQREEDGPKGNNTVGPGVFVYRNVFDLRVGTYNRIPTDPGSEANYKPLTGRMCGDHGGPVWEPLFFYNNTVVLETSPWRNYYGAQLIMGVSAGTKRRLFDNIFVQLDGAVGTSFAGAGADLQVDGNLLFSKTASAGPPRYPAGSGAHDVFADPQLVAFDATSPLDVRLGPRSPAIDAGVALPKDWPDSAKDKGPRDIGALPAGSGPLLVGPSAAPPASP